MTNIYTFLTFFTFMSVCIVNYDIRILSALKSGVRVFVRILSGLKCRQNADRKYQHESKKCHVFDHTYKICTTFTYNRKRKCLLRLSGLGKGLLVKCSW